jgi:hypothetical protein
MLKTIPIKGLVYSMFIFSIVFFMTMVIFFFLEIATGTSPYTAGGIAAPIQLYYNLLHGYYFNTSLFASELTGQSVGFTNNPFSYLHIFAIHTYISSFVFAPLWNLWPNVYGMYGLVLCINYFSLICFTILILRKWSPNNYKVKTLLALTLLFSSGFLFTFQQNAQLLLFSTPFILGAVYFLWIDKKLYFSLCIVFLSLVSEDAALVVLTFSIYIYFFEHNRRWYAITAGIFSLVYLVCVLLIVQPAARYYLGYAELNTALVVFRYIFDFSWSSFLERIWGLAPALIFIISFPIVGMIFPKAAIPWKKVFAIAILAPLPHWGESVVVGASHHLSPVVVFMYVALIMALGAIKDKPTLGSFTPKNAFLTILLFVMFSTCNLRVLISNVPAALLKPLYTALGFKERVEKINDRLAEEPKNRSVIKIAGTIPRDRSLVYLTNSSIEGFIADRTHIWKFPDYLEQADYILIQPEGRHSFFDGKKAGGSLRYGDLINPRAAELYFSSSDRGVITNEVVATIRSELVNARKLYRIAVDNDDVVLLERIIMLPSPIPPPSTLGFDWLSKILKEKNDKKD